MQRRIIWLERMLSKIMEQPNGWAIPNLRFQPKWLGLWMAAFVLGGWACKVPPSAPSTVTTTTVVAAPLAVSPPCSAAKVIPNDTTTTYSTTTEALRSGTIPDSVFEMLELRRLHIQGEDCDMYKVDENGQRIIDCWMISEIPAQIQNLKKLQYLGLNVNAISQLPSEIAALHSLRDLYLDDNLGLSEVDPIITLDSLEGLSLNGCNIKYMPWDIGKLKRLKVLGLAGNPIDEAEQKRIRAALPHCEVYF